MPELKVSEPKPSKCGNFTTRTVKTGNRLLGTIETPKLKPGQRPEGIFWGARDTVRVSDGGMFLTVDQAYLRSMRSYGVVKVGLREPDGTTFKIDYEKVVFQNLGAVQSRYMSIATTLWEVDLPPESVRAETLMGKMRLAGRGRRAV